ncbi:hypothetical protein AB0C34_29445 [Nocardia sp. NPDC049220]|uniref:hypothetical protein n=1 Tax=Nocardia sp. NPDC049220 TaxID=3155273 RepID=UPI003401F160
MSTFAGFVVTVIETVWVAIRDQHPDVPDVVVTMAGGSIGSRRAMRLGSFGPDRWLRGREWMPELFVGGEGFALGARDVLGTLLHEAAHGAARTRGVQDVSRGGAYHNGKYRDIATEFGLDVVRQGHRGWSETTVRNATAKQYHAQIDALGSVLTAHRRSEHDPAPGAEGREGGDDEERAPRSGFALTCHCDPARRIRAAKRSVNAGPILCGVCQHPFTVPDSATMAAGCRRG